jgi:2-succinyl-6-hydroxy-2,4-cyclohexadiene-1-carboxylate synthase
MLLNGVEFHVERDSARQPALLLLHGFTGSTRAWDAPRPSLAARAGVVALDLIGHGASAAPADPERYSFDWAARDLAALLDALDLAQVDLLGYSLGGRLALHFALQHPHRVRRLILESASPGISDPVDRCQPLLALAPHVAEHVRTAQRVQRLRNNPLGLANSLRGMGAGQQAPLWDDLPRLRMPTLLIVGARDARYRDIAARMQTRLPDSRCAQVADAGHTVHLDQPGLFGQLVNAAGE